MRNTIFTVHKKQKRHCGTCRMPVTRIIPIQQPPVWTLFNVNCEEEQTASCWGKEECNISFPRSFLLIRLEDINHAHTVTDKGEWKYRGKEMLHFSFNLQLYLIYLFIFIWVSHAGKGISGISKISRWSCFTQNVVVWSSWLENWIFMLWKCVNFMCFFLNDLNMCVKKCPESIKQIYK